MKSMTGFGKSEEETSLGKILVEARAENHRFLDIDFQFPEAISSIEPELTQIVKKSIIRGKVRITIAPEVTRSKPPVINIELAKESLKTLERLKRELGMKEQTSLEHLLMIKEFFSSETKPIAGKKDLAKIKRALMRAVERLDETRVAEGKKLEKDLKHRIERVEKLIGKVKVKRENSTREISEKLRERMNKLLEDTQIDETRLYQEIAFLIERSDITEEIVRLGAHIDKFKEILSKEGSIGRELDFLLQEMNREAGTISAKSKDAEISHVIIEFRSEIEKMREQVQNIE
jgi:uncharacterized protein (TIGR00255 family)